MKPKLFFKRNSSTILTVLGCAGVVATAVLSAKAAPKAKRLLANAELEKGEELTVLEKTETVALTYLPVILTGSATIFCICGAQILNQHQQASMASAYALLDQSCKDYRRKLKELYGEEADQRIIEAIAVEKAEKVHIQASYLCSDCDISSDKSVGRPVLFYEEYSKRFFRATVEQVQNAEYHLNRNYALGGSVILNELYSFLGLSSTDFGEVLGWAPTDEGEYWIEFNHRRAKLKDGTEFYIIEMPFEPRVNYDDYYESEEEYYANNPNSPKLQML